MPSNDLYTLYAAEQGITVPVAKPTNYDDEKAFEYAHTPYVDETAPTVDELDGVAADFVKQEDSVEDNA